MKHLMLAACCAALATGVLAGRQVSLNADIPFAFHACNTLLPPGSYEVGTTQGLLYLRRDGSHPSACAAIALPLDGSGHDASLVFTRYGDSYFLKDIWGGPAMHSTELPPSRKEKELAANVRKEDARRNMIVSLNRQ